MSSSAPDRVSQRAASFTESVIREMTRHATLHGAVNLAQGFPDFPCPPELKEAAKAAIDADINQYAITWGARGFREAIAAKTARHYTGWAVDPETDITVTCGATEGMIAAMLALVNPGEDCPDRTARRPHTVGRGGWLAVTTLGRQPQLRRPILELGL